MTHTRTQPWPAASWQPALLFSAGSLAAMLLGTGSLLLLVRRLSGAFIERPSAAAAVATLGGAMLLAVAARLCALQTAHPAPPRLSTWSVPSIGLLSLAIAILPGQHWVLLVMLVATVACEEVWAWFVAPPWGASPTWFPARVILVPIAETGIKVEVERADTEEVLEPLEDELEPESIGEGVTHQLVRHMTPAGVEVSGVVQTSFEPGQRTAIEHVAFCPPFDKTPVAEVHQLSGPDARARITHVLPHGVRIEVRLTQPATEAVSVVHEVAVHSA